jgi:hypothetical protein
MIPGRCQFRRNGLWDAKTRVKFWIAIWHLNKRTQSHSHFYMNSCKSLVLGNHRADFGLIPLPHLNSFPHSSPTPSDPLLKYLSHSSSRIEASLWYSITPLHFAYSPFYYVRLLVLLLPLSLPLPLPAHQARQGPLIKSDRGPRTDTIMTTW